MANTFRNFSSKDISTSNTVVYKADVSGHDATIVLGLTISNKSTNSVKATAYLTSNTVHAQSSGSPNNSTGVGAPTNAQSFTVLNEVPIPSGSSLEVFQGQKMVLNTNDIVTLKSDTANTLDSVLSIMEQT
jgi:hypothetical protein